MVIFGPPGSGKRTLERAAQSTTPPIGRALHVSVCSAVEPPAASLDALLKELGRLLLQASGRAEKDSLRTLESFWSPPILAKEKLRELMMHLLSPQPPGSPVRGLQVVNRADTRQEQCRDLGLFHHLGDRSDPLEVAVCTEAIVEARTREAISVRDLDAVAPGFVERARSSARAPASTRSAPIRSSR